MQGLKRAATILGLATVLAAYAPRTHAQTGTFLTVPMTELAADEREQPPILVYRLMKANDKGREKQIGKAYVRERSIEAKIFSIYNITFTQPNDSTYIEEVNIPMFLGAYKESYLYTKDTLWEFVEREGSLLYDHPEKDKFLSTRYPERALTPPELFQALVTGHLADTSLTFVMGEQYRLPKTDDRRTNGNHRLVRLDFLDLKKNKNDVMYIDDPVTSYFDQHGIPQEAHITVTDVEYRKGVRHETKVPAKLVLEYVDKERFRHIYQNESLTQRQAP